VNGPDIHILSVGTALPCPAVDNATLARRFGMDTLWEQWVDAFIGTRTRHLAVDLDTGEVRHSLADMGEAAGRRALAAAGLAPSDVDVMVMGTATPDTLMPATVNVVADRLGINGIPTYQLFGDGAGAAVLSVDPRPGALAIRQVLNRLTGLNRAPGQIVEWFGMADRQSTKAAVNEDYKMIEESVPVMAAEILAELLDDVGWKDTDFDYLLPPQLSGRMTTRIMEHLAVPGPEEISCVIDTGNTGNALPFLQLERALAHMDTGDRAIGIAVESSKWIKAGFALEKA
jgi:3-oxoacyl-[acyl-carrier-protein] synthase-3